MCCRVLPGSAVTLQTCASRDMHGQCLVLCNPTLLFQTIMPLIAQRKYTTVPLLDIQSMSGGVPMDESFEQWLIRALNDPTLPGVLDLSQCAVLRTRSSSMTGILTAEELRQLKLALQSNSNIRFLKICVNDSEMGPVLFGVDIEIAETLGKMTALQQLNLGGSEILNLL